MMWYGVVWCSVMWYDVVWCSMMRYDVVWCSMMWYDVVYSECITPAQLSHTMYLEADTDDDGTLHLLEMIDVFKAYDANRKQSWLAD